jgi:hypothetical protein
MNLKTLILNAAPYGLVRNYKQKKQMSKSSFWDEYVKYLVSGDRCEFLTESPVRAVVSLQGLGHTGSGAVLDLLREYEKTVVVGVVDEVGSLSTKDESQWEMDFARHAGGLFEIEKYLTIHNSFLQDALLHRFMLITQHSKLYQNVPEARKCFFEFFRQICTCYDDVPWHCYNPHLDYQGMNNILFLNSMGIREYRVLCRRFLYTLFNCFRVKSDELLVLDQFNSDNEFDYSKYYDYIPNLKPIFVYRDPRDVYVFAKENDVCWIPNSSVDRFIDWYKRSTCFDFSEIQGYSVSFERLIKEYGKVVSEIEDYLQLENVAHAKPMTRFNPEVSAKGVGIWKNHTELEADFSKIKESLGFLIYYRD